MFLDSSRLPTHCSQLYSGVLGFGILQYLAAVAIVRVLVLVARYTSRKSGYS